MADDPPNPRADPVIPESPWRCSASPLPSQALLRSGGHAVTGDDEVAVAYQTREFNRMSFQETRAVFSVIVEDARSARCSTEKRGRRPAAASTQKLLTALIAFLEKVPSISRHSENGRHRCGAGAGSTSSRVRPMSGSIFSVALRQAERTSRAVWRGRTQEASSGSPKNERERRKLWADPFQFRQPKRPAHSWSSTRPRATVTDRSRRLPNPMIRESSACHSSFCYANGRMRQLETTNQVSSACRIATE